MTEEGERVNILYYGDPGSGKTTSVAGLARLGQVVHVDAEAGVKAKPLRSLGIPIENISRYRTISYATLEALFWKIKGELEDGNGPVGVFIDSLTEVQTKLLEDTVENAVEKAQFAGKPRDRHDVFRDDWGRNTSELREIVRKFRDLDCHVGFCCLERRTQDDETGEVQYGPALTPSLAGSLMGYVDIICHTQVIERKGEEDEYVGVCRPIGKYHGKDRFGVLPRRLVDPSMDRVVAYVHGTLTRESDELQAAAEERWREERTERTVRRVK